MARHRRQEVRSEAVEEKEPEAPEEKVTTVLVRGRSAMPATQIDGKRWGHWRAGEHWPGTDNKEVRVTIKQLDELKEDPNLTLMFDPGEEQLARINTAPDAVAKSLAVLAAEAELKAAELKAQAKIAELQAEAEAADKHMKATRAKLAAARAGV